MGTVRFLLPVVEDGLFTRRVEAEELFFAVGGIGIALLRLAKMIYKVCYVTVAVKPVEVTFVIIAL